MNIAAMALALEVVLWHHYRAEEERGLDQAVALWNRSHPDTQVKAIAYPDEAFTQKIAAAIPNGNGPDLFINQQDKIGSWAKAHLVAPLDDSAAAEERFLPGTVAPLRYAGRLYGIPLAFKSPVLFYRTDLVARAPQTTGEMLALCREQKAAGRFCLAYEAGNFFHHAAWYHGFGGTILQGSPLGTHLAEPAGVAALAFVRQLVDAGYIPDETTGTLVAELMNTGKTALAINGPWFLGELDPHVPFGIAPLPIVSATGRRAAPLVTIEAVMLSPQSTHPAPALAFASWLAGPEAAALRARVGRQTVADRRTWEDPAIARDPRLQPFRRQLESAVAMSSAAEMNPVWEPANQALRRVLRGAADPQAALTEADRRVAIALRPPPPTASPVPFLVVGALLLGGIAWLTVQRMRATASTIVDGGPLGKTTYAYGYLAPAMIGMVVLVFIPFSVGVGMSVYHYDGADWQFVGLHNFADILGARDYAITDPLSFYFTLVVTASWTVLNVALHVLIGVTLALLLRDPLLRMRGIYRVLLIVPWAVPNYITALIWKSMFHRQFGSINALLGLLGLEPVAWFSRFATAFAANVTTNVWLGFPFMMVVTLGALANIPKELEEAAALDGASRLARLRHVVLPLLGPMLVPSVLLSIVWTFNMFNVVFLVSAGEPDGATDILISQAYRWAFTRGHRYGYAAAYAVLIFLVLLGQSVLTRRATAARLSDTTS